MVFYPDEAVARLHVLEAFFIHLPGQPLPPVQSDLDIEGKPGLDPLTTGEDAKVSLSGDQDDFASRRYWVRAASVALWFGLGGVGA
jgi:hypothetical protein